MRRGRVGWWPGVACVVMGCAALLEAASLGWTPTTTTGAPLARSYASAIWTDTDVIVWGGWSFHAHADGGRYDPMTDSWTPTSITGAPSGRYRHSALWTGSEMIVWGGFDGFSGYLASGGMYDPSSDTWAPTSATGAPSGRDRHAAVWTGSEMIIWGGSYWNGAYSVQVGTGARYDPAKDSWQEISAVGAPSPRAGHVGVWTGERMIIWGGVRDGQWQEEGALYDPATDTWSPMSRAGAPIGRLYDAAVWTGSKLLVWGRNDEADAEPGDAKAGGLYDPVTDTWTPITAVGAPRERSSPATVWTGTRMIIWGGSYWDGISSSLTNDGAAYDPATDSWSPTPETNAPAPRAGHTAAWAGTSMIVWGGSVGGYVASGGRLELGSPAPADLSISKTNGRTDVVASTRVDYTIVASNAGPTPVTGAKVVDEIPDTLLDATWSCAGTLGGVCSPVGSGRIDDFVDLPVGASVTYALSATLDVAARGELVNLAVVAPPLDVVEVDLADNAALDADPIVIPPDLSIADAPRVLEGDVGSRELLFDLELSKPAAEAVSISYHTFDGTAETGVDYTATSGELTFEPGETRLTVAVETLADEFPEPHETVYVRLTSPQGAVIVRDVGEGVIADDDSTRGDLDGDGRSDILWRHTDGSLRGWLMNGAAVAEAADLPWRSPLWAIGAVADFDADGRSDILWRHVVSRQTELWLMDGLQVRASGATSLQCDPSWRLEGTGDVDGDGAHNVLWRRTQRGLSLWLMNGTTVSFEPMVNGTAPGGGRLVGVADFDRDGRDDILWLARDTGLLHLWLMDVHLVRDEEELTPPRGYRVAGLGDLDGDGRADILFRDGSGRALAWFMDGLTVSTSAPLPNLSGHLVVVGAGDFDGDGLDDLLLKDGRTGTTSLQLMEGAAVKGTEPTSQQMDGSWVAVSPGNGGPAVAPRGVVRRSR